MAEDSETKHGNKNGKKEGVSGSSFFTWFMVIALLGVWTSVAVVWFELVDYEEVLGKLGIYDADGDGDFDVEDAKILLGRPPGGVVKKKAKAGEIKEPARKEKQELKKESKDEEKKKLKRKTDDLDKKDKKAADKAKRDKKAEKERSGLDKAVKNKGTAKELDSGKDKDMKKIAKNLYRVSESSAKGEEKRKRVKG
ncbi:PREDICTED: aspartyl/asparaginyl beta-hydroxylase isoform X2 [Gekko japonicus]|uniref:Aspartyl/asparaginyl beta-hydroxylase isoform X2 n=1 Tax=Gekko japonicus TaxID=146911 RepID=A0ABM1KB69_GEKJA|nr:PREDICTED: aspartyl/asparaginyl beta-hydroxylase isoform X2 [Gekko japonicus]